MGTVLVVDDEPDVRLLMSTLLSAAGHRVIEAAEGKSALEALAAGDVDVVLLDLMMPVMDGWAVLWTLHDSPEHHPPVIVMSARPEYREENPPLGAVRYLHKPFPLEQAVTSVQEVLAGRN